jgi:hypothetical protein
MANGIARRGDTKLRNPLLPQPPNHSVTQLSRAHKALPNKNSFG